MKGLWKNLRAAGVPERPKVHLMMHIPLRAAQEGSPALHATWADETLNRRLASCGLSAHRLVWGVRVLAHFAAASGRQGAARAAKRRRGAA